MSDEHFTVDGTLIDAWASMRSFRPKDGSGEPPRPGKNGERNFRSGKRSNPTHASTTDPDAPALPQGGRPEQPLGMERQALRDAVVPNNAEGLAELHDRPKGRPPRASG